MLKVKRVRSRLFMRGFGSVINNYEHGVSQKESQSGEVDFEYGHKGAEAVEGERCVLHGGLGGPPNGVFKEFRGV